MFALADCNNFFVSCERVFRPDLQGRPVVVLSGNDGCVVSRSNEAKKMGVKMGVPLHEIKDDVSKYDIQCFSSNFSLYGDLSARVMSLLSRHTNRFEQYSIDEAFLDVSHVPVSELKTRGENLVREIRQGVGIPISIGIAPTRTLAKVASKYAKQYPGYHGVCVIDSESKRRKALAGFPLADVWGIGRKAQRKLEKFHLSTALDFAECSAEMVRNLLHKPGWQTWCELNGEDCIPYSELPDKQTITQSRTFAEVVTELEVLEKHIADFTASCARKLRAQHSVCSQLVVFAETSRFRSDMQQIGVVRNLSVPSNLTAELVKEALTGLREVFVSGCPYKRAGVVFTVIQNEAGVALDLFDSRPRQKESNLQKAVDQINGQFGKTAVQMAAQIASSSDPTVLHSDYLSPCYSTNIRDIITLKC